MLPRISSALAALLALGLAAAAHATDLYVAEGGAGGAYPTIGHAMAAAQPGDRILVMPGAYPPFQFSVAVDVIGLGATPGDVRIDRVDYHVSVPVIGYDTVLSNVTVGSSSPTSDIAISGNELPPGTFFLQDVVVEGSVFLRGGATGFLLALEGCLVRPHDGQTALGAAAVLGGPNNVLQARASRFEGRDASTVSGPALAGLALIGGTHAVLSDVRVLGGKGVAAAGLADGADGLVSAFDPYPVAVRLDGAALVAGGDGAGTGIGGDGVDLVGSVEVGQATVQGGAPGGLPYRGTTPTPLPIDLHLAAQPLPHDGAGPPALHPGDTLSLSMQTPPADTLLLLAFDLDVPPPVAPDFVLASTAPLIVFGNALAATVPPPPQGPLPGVFLHAQGVVRHQGALLLSEAAGFRIDF